MIPITEVFNIQYGNQFDFLKMDTISDEKGINFISRSSQNNGFIAKVEKYNDVEPFPAGLITVTMGGSYLLASFVQPNPFYTAQNIKVLTPKFELNLNQKLFYCCIIEANRFRYHSHSREANSTFNSILIPSPNEFSISPDDFKIINPFKNDSVIKQNVSINTSNWLPFKLSSIFEIYTSKDENLTDRGESGNIPYISSTQSNNGISAFIDSEPSHDNNVLTVARNGSIGSTFYQPIKFCASPDDVRIFKPKFIFNKYIGLFLSVLIEKEKYRYAYGRKFGTNRMKNTIIYLPVSKDGNPDWEFMECFIKSLPYSSNL